MKIYFAPMEGITDGILRHVHQKLFGGVDVYCLPFHKLTQSLSLTTREKRDIDPAENSGMNVLPQALTRNPEQLRVWLEYIKELGYTCADLNLGCPSPTVTKRGRGSGMLRDPGFLQSFLDYTFSHSLPLSLSVKTRIGFEDPQMWPALLDVYSHYPVHELIIHPRLRREMYTGAVHLDAFKQACETFDPGRLCYNGDLFDIRRYEEIRSRFPDISRIMIGRGLLGRPYLSWLIQSTDMEGDCESIFSLTSAQLRSRLRAFCDEIFEEYRKIFQSERDVCMHMKEIWANLSLSFKDSERLVRKLMKCRTAPEYHAIVRQIFDTLPLSDQDLFRG